MRKLDPQVHLPLRRIVQLDAGDAHVSAQLVDNVHHFAVAIRHDGETVTAIVPQWHRVPWTTCPHALDSLQALVGHRLGGGSPPGFDKARQCTHLHDLSKLAIAHALHGGRCRYDIDAWLMDKAEGVCLRVRRNDNEVLRLDAIQGLVVSGGPFQGFSLLGAVAWPEAVTDPDTRTAMLLMRRAHLVFVEAGPNRNIKRAVDVPQMAGACFTFQAGMVGNAVRPDGFTQYPADSVESMLR